MTLDPLELASEVVTSLLMWVLGPKLGSSVSASSVPNPWVFSPVPECWIMMSTDAGELLLGDGETEVVTCQAPATVLCPQCLVFDLHIRS